MKTILILSANPKGTSQLRLDEEVREIKNANQLSQNREQFKIVTELAVRVEDLPRALLEYQPTVVHFCGHGVGSDGLAFEDNDGELKLVSTEALATLFQLFQQQVECVLLNACYSEAQALAIYQHIDCVIGMSQAIGDKAAINFAVGFYNALFANRTLFDCYELGCASINLEAISEYSTPKIKVRRRRNQTEDNKEYTTSNDKTVQNRSVSIGGNANGSAIIQTGSRNVANISLETSNLLKHQSINIYAEISYIQEILAEVSSNDRRKIDNAFADIEEELDKPAPDKNEVGQALERALNYAKKAEAFTTVTEKLQHHLTNTVTWLGENWYKLLKYNEPQSTQSTLREERGL